MSDARTRTYTWEDPLGAIEGAAGLSGLEVMQRMASGELARPPIADTLGFRLVAAERGRAVFECEPAEFHYNPIGTVHAGLASTLLDSAMGCAFVTTLEQLVGWTTLELKANFTRPLTADTGLVRMIPRHRVTERTRDIPRTISVAIWPVLAASTVIAAAVFVFAPQLAHAFIHGANRELGVQDIRLLAPFLPAGTAITVVLAGTRGFGTMLPYVTVYNIAVPVLRPLHHRPRRQRELPALASD